MPEANPLLLAVQKLREVVDLLTPPAQSDPLVHAVAEIAGSTATVLAARAELHVEYTPEMRLHATPKARAAVTVELKPGVTTHFVAGDPLFDEPPPFDASEYERPHHVACLCSDCNATRAAGGSR